MKEKIISKVTSFNGQRRVYIPKKEKNLKEGDLVEVKKLEFKDE